MNVLFVSLTRFGDLLQTQASINDVALAGHSVGVVCLHNFLPTVHLMKGIAHVFPFIEGSLLARMAPKLKSEDGFSYDGNSEGWLEATKELKEWRDMVWREFTPDVIVNLSPAMSSRLLASYLGTGKTLGGFSLETQASYHNNSVWASVMQGAKGQRGIIPYNLVDIFRGITADALCQASSTQGPNRQPVSRFDGACGLSRLLWPEEPVLQAVEKQLRQEALALSLTVEECALWNGLPSRKEQLAHMQKAPSERTPSGKTVGKAHIDAKLSSERKACGFFAIQLGASAVERQWPVKSFAKVGDFLWEKYGLVPVLLGTKNELALAKEYEKIATSPHICMVGKTGLGDLSAYLLQCSFLLTNDTGTMHLAAGLGLPSFAIFLATAQPFDTGPYLTNCYCFEPDLPCHPCNFNVACPHEYICRESITPETVLACMEHFLKMPLPSDSGPTALAKDAPHVKGNEGTAKGIMDGAANTFLIEPDGHYEELGNTVAGQGARVWLSVTDEKGALSLRSVIPLEEGAAPHVYARSRGPLIKLQRVMLWAFLASYQSLQESGEAYEAVRADISLIDPCWFMQEAQEAIGRDAERLLGLIDILERQGSVLLLRSVELMQQRFLESWEAVYRELSESVWFCFLASLWLDKTNVSGIEFEELMGVVHIVKGIFEDLVGQFSQEA